MFVRSDEHNALSSLTNKKVKPTMNSVKDHLLLYNHTPSLGYFSILANEAKELRLENKSLLIKPDNA